MLSVAQKQGKNVKNKSTSRAFSPFRSAEKFFQFSLTHKNSSDNLCAPLVKRLIIEKTIQEE